MRVPADGNLLYDPHAMRVDNFHPGFLPDADIDVPAVRGNGEIIRSAAERHAGNRFQAGPIYNVQHVLALARHIKSRLVRRKYDRMRILRYRNLADSPVGGGVDDRDTCTVRVGDVDSRRASHQWNRQEKRKKFHRPPVRVYGLTEFYTNEKSVFGSPSLSSGIQRNIEHKIVWG